MEGVVITEEEEEEEEEEKEPEEEEEFSREPDFFGIAMRARCLEGVATGLLMIFSLRFIVFRDFDPFMSLFSYFVSGFGDFVSNSSSSVVISASAEKGFVLRKEPEERDQTEVPTERVRIDAFV